jgi:hypothetical protein
LGKTFWVNRVGTALLVSWLKVYETHRTEEAFAKAYAPTYYAYCKAKYMKEEAQVSAFYQMIEKRVVEEKERRWQAEAGKNASLNVIKTEGW